MSDIKISNHALMQFRKRCSLQLGLRGLISLANDIKAEKRKTMRVIHYKKVHEKDKCFLDYKTGLIFIFNSTMSRLITIRNDLFHFVKNV